MVYFIRTSPSTPASSTKKSLELSISGPGPMSDPMSGPEGPRTKDQRPGPRLNTKFGLSPPPPTSKLFLRVFKGVLEGDLEENLKGNLKESWRGTWR